ncbi:MAG TPA: hypothetical protein VE153_19780, partial [Myxococcus sp.]|nr:hypothetical protein [Myxococcus sp.]
KLLRRALDKASEHSPPDSQRMAAALLGLSQVSLRLGQLEEARHHLERAVRLLVPAREDAEPGLVQRARAAAWLPGSEPLAHGLLHTLARVLEQEGDLAGAEWLLEQALLALRDRAGRPMDPDTAVELGALRLRLGDAVGAVRLLEFTLAELEPRQDMPRERLVPVMVTLAAALRGTGDVARAEALARRVREAQATREDLDSAVDPLMPAAAGTKGSVPAPVRSEELRALTRRAEEEEDLAKAARTALLRVDVEGRQGAWARAREAADEALQLARRAGEDALVAEAYRLRADACLHGSLYEDAQLGYEEAIRRYALLGHERMEAQSRMLLVALLLQLRRLERVAEHVDWLRRYAARGAATEDEQGELRALLRLADTLPGQGTGGKDPLQ